MKAYLSLIKKSKSRQFRAGVDMTSCTLLWPSLACAFCLQGHKMAAGAPARMPVFQAKRRGRGKVQKVIPSI